MPSEFNHIDEFVRRKEAQANADLSSQDKHWQQMQQLLAGKAPAAKLRNIHPRLLLMAGALVLAAALFLIIGKNTVPRSQVAASSPPGYIQDANPPLEKKDILAGPQPVDGKLVVIAKPKKTEGRFQVSKRIAIAPPAQADPVYKEADPSPGQELLMAAFFEQLEKGAEDFLIDNSRDTMVACREGTSLLVPANSFQGKDGKKVQGPVKISIREFYEFCDIIGNKLATVSYGKKLETAGMVHISATQDGVPVFVKPGCTLRLNMPTENYKRGMELFYGEVVSGGTAQPATSSTEPEGRSHGTKDMVPVGGAFAPLSGQASINWVPVGEAGQLILPSREVKVIDLLNDPREVVERNGKKIAKFILSDNSSLSVEQARMELKKRYDSLYDEIRVRKGWRQKDDLLYNTPGFTLAPGSVRGTPTRDGLWFMGYENGLIGDSILMDIVPATVLGFISSADSARSEELFASRFDSLNRSIDYTTFKALNTSYSFNISNLGWINCDRFLALSKDKLTDFTVDAGEGFRDTYLQSFLVFENISSVMPGRWTNGKIVFAGVPLDEKASIVCVGIKNGRAYCSIKPARISKAAVVGLQLKETTPEQFREELKQFGNVQRG